MPDILLIQPPIRDFYLTAKRTIPYGLACIASALIRESFSVRILDALATGRSQTISFPKEMNYLKEFYSGTDISPFSLFSHYRHYGLSFEQIGDVARDISPTIVGISSLFTAYSDEAVKTAEAIRLKLPHAVIVLGGHHPTEMPEEVLQHRCVDFVLRGEGEIGMPVFARALIEDTPLENVPGICFRTDDGSLFISPPAIMKDLNEVPLPEIGLIDSDFYRRKKKPCAVVVASRGCPLKCSYCSIGCAEWSRFRLKSTERVLDELEAVIHSGARFIDFEDENISFNREWFLELLAGISERLSGIDVEFRAMNGLFPPTIDREVVGAMKRAGFTALNLSLCTTCREQLKTFRRPDVREAFENALELSAEYGMDCVGYIIAGALGQRAEDSVADLLYLADKKVVAGVSIFYPAPGSSEFLKCRNRKILPQKNSLLRATTLPVEDTTTRVEAATLLRLGRLLNFLKSLEPEEIKEVFSPDLRAGIDSMPLDARNFAQKDDLNRRIQELAQTAASAGKSARHGESPLPTRREIGKLLLSSFLRDGVLLGIDPARKVFEHKVSHSLCKLLRDGLLQLFTQNNPQL